HLGPDRFAFTDDDTGAMLERFVRQGTDGNAAHHYGNAPGAIKIGDLVSFFDLGGESGQRDQVEVVGQFATVVQLRDFAIFDFEFRRCQASQSEQAEAWQ